MSQWIHRHCERCWFDRPTERTGRPFGVLPDGAYRLPHQLVDPEPGMCCGCGGLTLTGIYVRTDPAHLPCAGQHPTDGADDG
jgi:hypothetical protein